jgi:histidinol-phosphate aminotransferase
MRELADLIKPAVRRLAPYTLTPHRTSIKINQNENPFGMPLAIREEVERRLRDRDWARYPDFIPVALQETLAHFAGWRSDGVLVGNGSNELIQNLLTVIVEGGAKVVLSEPTFTVYRLMVGVLGGDVVNVPPKPDFCYDMPAIQEAAIRSQAKAVILCSPNNPTGAVVAESDLISLLEAFDGLVVIDEAYHEFSDQNFVPLLARHPRLVVLRTFSKAMAMAGLRIGYFLGAPELAVEINKAKLPYNVNFFSLTAAQVAAERYETDLRPLVKSILAERARLITRINELKWPRLVPTQANFMLAHTPEIAPSRVFDEMLKRDILIRDVSRYPMLAEYFRFNVGAPDENDATLAAFAEIRRTQLE